MPSAPRPLLLRAGIAAFASIAVVGAVASCSSGADEPADAAAASEIAKDQAHALVTEVPVAAPDPDAVPADEADAAAITALVAQFYETNNAGQAQAWRSTICEDAKAEFADIEDTAPAVDPMIVDEVSDIQVNSAAGTATAHLSYTSGDSANFKFTRADDGQWKACGSP